MKKINFKLFFGIFCLFIFSTLGIAQPCSTAPGTNAATSTQTIVCPGGIAALSLVNTYSVSGLTYQWYSSTISSVGPFTIILGANQSTYTTVPLYTSTYFQCIITCTNTNQNITAASIYIQVLPATTTSTVPYYEGFEGITYTNQLPNCSWLAPNLGTTFNTYTTSLSGNRIPCGGAKFAVFSLPSNNNMVYTNGIQMYPGITYSASLYFTTEYFGYTNWTQLALLVGPNQSTSGLAPITATSPAVSGPCKLLSGTFTVASPGLYYIAIRANATSGNAFYLSFDELSVVIPCTGTSNTPTLSVLPNNISVCEGTSQTFTASGADTYYWGNGATGSVATITYTAGTFGGTLIGTNTLTGCTATAAINVTVNPSPVVFVVANPPVVCPGFSVILSGFGASFYQWTPGPIISTSTIIVSPTVTTCYTLNGLNNFSCSSTSTLCVQVLPVPTITAVYSPTTLCWGEEAVLSGNGAVSYQWNGFAPGNPVTVYPLFSTTYTLTGTNSNGCSSTITLYVNTEDCSGLNEFTDQLQVFSIHPNPNKGEFYIESSVDGGFKIKIVDAIGRLILEEETAGKIIAIDLRNMQSGIYYSKIEYASRVEVIKFIKQ